ncbi:MAG: hypothetical protein V4813_10115 [Gemmatimonadota bacterium]
MFVPAIRGQFAEELGELHDGSVSLFVTLPVFRTLLVSEGCSQLLRRFEGVVGEHLAHLDGILGDVLVRRDRSDGDLTRSLFRALAMIRADAPSPQRDADILTTLEQAQIFLMGSCGFALRFARQAGVDRSVQVLEESMARIGSLALHFPSAHQADSLGFQRTDAVA